MSIYSKEYNKEENFPDPVSESRTKYEKDVTSFDKIKREI
jgi:hypothetical protein